jgi:CheY-like chemotaxis protein
MVYGFAKQSGGHAQIYSEPGQGTTVRLYLPRAQEGEAIVAQRAEVTDLGYAVVEATNGPEALARLAEPGDIHLLFTDMVMPGGMHGPDLAEAAGRRKPGLKVLLTSGYAEPEVIRKGGIDGAGWLKKPYTALDLARKLREVFDAHSPPGAG